MNFNTGARPPLKKQGSSICGGGAHPMAVALAPIPRVDYSMSKGGTRTWAVLLVFMFLCSSLYTVFSAKELAEMAVDFDGDGDVDLDSDMADDVDEVAEQMKRTIKDTTPSAVNNRPQEHAHHETRQHNTMQRTADDEEPDPDEDSMEQRLFAGLRQKIENKIGQVARQMKKVASTVQRQHTEAEEQEEQEDSRPAISKKDRKRMERERRRKQQEEKEKEEEKADDDDDDEDNDEEEEEVVEVKVQQQRRPKRGRRRQMVQEEEEEEEEKEETKESEEKKDDDDDDDEEEEKKNDDDDDDDDEDEKKEESKEDDKDDDDDDDEKKDEKDENKDDDDDEKEEEEEELVPRKHRRKRPRQPSPGRNAAAERECKRKNCPPAYAAEPRKSLLKQKRDSASSKRYHVYSESELQDMEDDDDDDDDEEGGDDQSEEEETDEQPALELVAVKKYISSGREAYKRRAITNRDDMKHREELDRADALVEKHDYASALVIFDSILRHNEESPRAHFGRARAFDIRAEYSVDDRDVDAAIKEYEEVIENDETPDALFRQAASRLIERARFRDQLHRALTAQRALIDRFPEEKKLQTEFALTFLMMKRHDDARKVLQNALDVDPNDAHALAYMGYIQKVHDSELELGVRHMQRGLRLAGDHITDAKFYYHLGDGLMQLGRTAEAYAVYEQAASLGIFLSAHQRSTHNIEGLTGRPWWSVEQTGVGKHLKAVERQWVVIRQEAERILESEWPEFSDENPSLTVDGDWRAWNIMRLGEWNSEHCSEAPATCDVLKQFAHASNATKGEIKLSLLSSGARVLPHCGPTNTKLVAHLGLVVPSEARLRVATERRGWKTGKFIIYDDSFDHEIAFEGAASAAYRLVLSIDLWHPEVDPRQRDDRDDD